MEVVKKNADSKEIIKYLKSIKVNSNSHHEEVETKKYIVSIVKIDTNAETLNSCSEDFNVYLLVQDKENNTIYGKYDDNYFVSNDGATNYYNALKSRVDAITDKEIDNLIKNDKERKILKNNEK